MKLTELSPQAIRKFQSLKWDGILEKHEGPFTWSDTLHYRDPDFLIISGRPVLLPLGRDHHPHIAVIRCDVREDGGSLTLFFKDTTYCDDSEEDLFCGYVAVCDRIEDEKFFVAFLLHEWYIINQ